MYIMFQHLLLWLVVMMQPQPDMLGLTCSHAVAGGNSIFYLYHAVGYDWGTPHTSYS
jgi:hypothetical protein